MERPIRAISTRGLRVLRTIPAVGLILLLALLMVIVANTAMPAPVLSATAGPSDAGTGANVNGPGTIAWSNPGNITPPTGTPYATADLTTLATSEYLQGTNYGFAIPSDQVITGIQVSINRMSSSNAFGNSVNDVDLYLLKAGAIAGTN